MKTYLLITIILIVTISVFFLTRTDQDKEGILLSEEKEELLYSAEDEGKAEETETLHTPEEAEEESEPLPPVEEDSEEPEEETTAANGFIQCLKEEGVVIYGSTTCPACARLEEKFGGYEVIGPIYLDCSPMGTEEEQARCREEMKGRAVPETQINGEVFKVGVFEPEALAKETGCEYN